MSIFGQGSFIIPEGTTPDMLRAKRERLAALMPRYGQAKYVGEGIGQLFSGIAQGRQNRAMDAYEGDQRKAAADMFNSRGPLSVLGMQPQGAPIEPRTPDSAGGVADDTMRALGRTPMGPYRDAIASIESAGSGDYSAVGPTNPKLGRALGRYQIMEANIGPWSREVLGREVTPDEFLANPQIQDAIFDGKFGGYVEQFGPEGAAQAWFAGPGGVGKTDRKDVLGTSVGDYTQKFASALGGQPTMSAQGRTGGGDVSYLMQLAANPWLSQEQRAVVMAELQQAQRQADPSYQMGLEMQRLQLDALRNPQAEFRMLTPEEVQARGLPPGAYQIGRDGKVDPVTKGGVNVTNNIGGDDKFGEEFAKLDAKALATISESGTAAQRNLGRIDQLEKLLQNSPTGLSGAAKLRAGEWGINTEGLSDLQAAQALINSLVPEQRQPGSGPMSDADLELFKQSLPRIINQPGGNQLIINTMRAIAQYDAEGAKIVQRLRSNEIDRATAFDLMLNRADPMAAFRTGLGAAPAAAAPTGGGVPTYNPQTGAWE